MVGGEGVGRIGSYTNMNISNIQQRQAETSSFKKWAVRVGRGILGIATLGISELIIRSIQRRRVARLVTNPEDRRVNQKSVNDFANEASTRSYQPVDDSIREANKNHASYYATLSKEDDSGVEEYIFIARGFNEVRDRFREDISLKDLDEGLVDALKEEIKMAIENHPVEVNSRDIAMDIIKEKCMILLGILNTWPDASVKAKKLYFKATAKLNEIVKAMQTPDLEKHAYMLRDLLYLTTAARLEIEKEGTKSREDVVVNEGEMMAKIAMIANNYGREQVRQIYNNALSEGLFFLRDELWEIQWKSDDESEQATAWALANNFTNFFHNINIATGEVLSHEEQDNFQGIPPDPDKESSIKMFAQQLVREAVPFWDSYSQEMTNITNPQHN